MQAFVRAKICPDPCKRGLYLTTRRDYNCLFNAVIGWSFRVCLGAERLAFTLPPLACDSRSPRFRLCLAVVISYTDPSQAEKSFGSKWPNRLFPSSLVPLFQSESKCETILMKMTLICMRMELHAELIFM